MNYSLAAKGIAGQSLESAMQSRARKTLSKTTLQKRQAHSAGMKPKDIQTHDE